MMKAKLLISQAEFAIAYVVEWRGWLLLMAERKTSKSRFRVRDRQRQEPCWAMDIHSHGTRRGKEENGGKGCGGELKVSAMVETSFQVTTCL
jgi:hypothetical protein